LAQRIAFLICAIFSDKSQSPSSVIVSLILCGVPAESQYRGLPLGGRTLSTKMDGHPGVMSISQNPIFILRSLSARHC
jgi:hypothetical protein